jgi:hypothetical protein
MLRLVRTSAIAAFTGTLRIICASPSGALRDFPSCVEMESNLDLVEQLYCCSDPVAYAI